MQYSYVAAAVLAFTSSVFAQTAGFAALTVPTQDQNVAAGSVLDITWQPSTGAFAGPITIQLLQGATPSTLEIGETIAASIDQSTGKFAWTVPKDLKSFATYGFKLTLDSTKDQASPVFQFSFPFHVTGLGSSPASSSSSSPSSAGGYPTGETTTVHLSTGTGYTAKPTSSSYSASSSVNSTSTSTYAPSTYSASPSASVPVAVYPTVNVTLSTTLRPTTAPTGTGSSPSSTATTPATVTGNSASTIARGGFAVAAGMVLALAL